MRPFKPRDGHDRATDTSGGSWPMAALEFLERSRDIASELVVDGTRGETSTSGREDITAPGSGSSVR
jgi:hypothetical protein